MAETPQTLGQLVPAASSLEDLYTSASDGVFSSIIVCNESGVADSFRIAFAPGGEPDNTKHYHYYDLPIDGNDTFIYTIGLGFQVNDVVRVWSTNGTCAFNATGLVIT